MKRSFIILLAILFLMIIFTNVVTFKNAAAIDEILGQAGGVKVDLTGDEKIFN